MKFLIVLSLLFAGCQSAAPIAPLPLPSKSVPEPRPVAAAPTPPANPLPVSDRDAFEKTIRQQVQLIEALISQNDALNAKLAEQVAVPNEVVTPNAPPAEVVVAPPSPPIVVPAPPLSAGSPPMLTVESSLAPNADGVIDLAAVHLAAAHVEPVNPFAVRTLPPEAIREITLHVGGIVGGPNRCAIINERLVQSGEMTESLAVERIESDAVFLRHGEHRMRLPVSEKSARVRLPL